ncbi:MAG: hypothetical protein BalsKO_32450 [Balneolaceae bacterium]
MNYLKNAISLILLLMISLNTFGQTSAKVKGIVLGFNNEPMLLAHVHLTPANTNFLTDNVIQQVEVDEDGTFELEVKKPGSYTLHLTGVHHKRYTTPITISSLKEIEIIATLGTHKQRPNRNGYVISSNSNNYNIMGGMRATRLEGNIYRLEVPEIQLPFNYQFAYGFPIAGISDRYELITSLRYGSDHYVAVVENFDENYITIDVSKFPPANLEPQVSFGNEKQNKLAQIQQYVNQQEIAYVRVRSNHLASGKELSSFTYNWNEALTRLSQEFEAAYDKETKDIVAIYKLKLGLKGAPINEEVAKYVLENVSPSSSAWAIEPNSIFIATNKKGGIRENQNYIDDMLAMQTNEEVVRNILLSLVRSTKEQADAKNHEYYYAKLVSQFPDSDEALQAKQAFTFKRKIEKGSKIPQFSISSLDDDTIFIRNENFEGKYYLIDIWATWCGPCIFEMESLHEVFKLYKDNNFDILSISIDEFKNYVTDFREQKWPMPWKNAYDKDGFRGEIMKLFEVYGIPRALLVSPEGEIVAMDSELRGKNLKRTLEKFLPNK